MIYYTTHEGGEKKILPIKSCHRKIAKQLYKNRRKVKGICYSRISKYKVHSVFFKTDRVWDSFFNGYRPKLK